MVPANVRFAKPNKCGIHPSLKQNVNLERGVGVARIFFEEFRNIIASFCHVDVEIQKETIETREVRHLHHFRT